MAAVTEVGSAADVGPYEIARNRRVTAGQVNAIGGKPIDYQTAGRRTWAVDGKASRADSGARAIDFYLEHRGVHAGNGVGRGAGL